MRQKHAPALIFHTPDGIKTLPQPVAVALCHVDPTTVARWQRTRHIPRGYRELLTAAARGHLIPANGTRERDWRGFHFAGDLLTTPDGDTLTPGRLRALLWRERTRTRAAPAGEQLPLL